MMIDWVSAKIPLSHTRAINGGKVTSTDTDGVLIFETNKRLPVEGSYSSTVTIRTLHTGPNGEIAFSGNPNKFMQGHNLYGSADLVPLMAATLERIFSILGIIPTVQNLQAIKAGDYPISRIDLTQMYELPTRSDVLAWIRAAAHASHSRHKSGSMLTGDTLYLGKKSRSWTLKFYSKGQELHAKNHELPENLLLREKHLNYADNKLRGELTLRSPELKILGLPSAMSFGNANLIDVFQKYRERITLAENLNLSATILDTLPHRLRSSYVLWEQGVDLRKLLSHNTFYRHRRELMEYGIHINVPCRKEESNVIPLLRVLEATPAKVPDFAIGTPLYWKA